MQFRIEVLYFSLGKTVPFGWC